MARRTFFSFHYQRDIWRVNQIRNIPNVTSRALKKPQPDQNPSGFS